MSPNPDLHAAWTALRQFSPVVVEVPDDVRRLLLKRYVDMSMRNGRLSVMSFGLMVFGLAYEAPLGPRLAVWALLAAMLAVRGWRVRRWLASVDAKPPRSDGVYDLLLLISSSFWGLAPWVLQDIVSKPNMFGVVYSGFVATALLSVTYLAALPASMVLVCASVLPLVAFMALQGSLVMGVLAAGTLVCTVALLLRVSSGHGALLQALAAERQNAALVQELQKYRQALESENASLGISLRDAAQAAHRDPLTGLFNRRHVAEYALSLAEPIGAGEEVTVCMVDVDHFKLVNDRHGHPVGDEVLCAVGELLSVRVRDGDCLARFGGEEFVVVLRRCSVKRGRRAAESLRHNVAAATIATSSGVIPVTVSVGLAQWTDGEDFDAVIRRADRALYEAKHSGRDRVEIDGSDVHRLTGTPTDFSTSGHLH